MRLRAVKKGVVVFLTLSTFILHKQREGSNTSPPSMNAIANFRELELEQELEFTITDPQILNFTDIYCMLLLKLFVPNMFG